MKENTSIVCCVKCQKEYSFRGIHTHFDRAHGSKDVQSKYSSGYHGKYDQIEYRKKLSVAGKKPKKIYDVVCLKCKKRFVVSEFVHKHPEKSKYFCSRSCANGRQHTDETKEKISSGVIARNDKCGITRNYFCRNRPCTKIRWLKCSQTEQFYCNRDSTGKIRHRSPYIDYSKIKLNDYRLRCNFNFSVKSYPDEFDLNLITMYGWYKPSNKGNNLTGVSRDHMFSVKHGFENNIDPNIIAHPANCELMLHGKNSSKNSNCSISYKELQNRISAWNDKYDIKC